MYLGNITTLGEEVVSCFGGVVSSSVLKVVRGVVLTRPNLEERARSTPLLQELVQALPPDLFRQALARVCIDVLDVGRGSIW